VERQKKREEDEMDEQRVRQQLKQLNEEFFKEAKTRQ